MPPPQDRCPSCQHRRRVPRWGRPRACCRHDKLPLLALLMALLAGCSLAGEPQQVGFTETRVFEERRPVAQTFRPRGPSVARLDVLVATYGVDAPEATLQLEVVGAGERRVATARGEEIDDTGWLAFHFPPIAANGEVFAAKIRYSGDDPVAYFVNPHDPYPEGRLVPGPGDIAFRVGHRPGPVAAADALIRVSEEFSARLARDPAFSLLWALALLAVFAATLLVLPPRKRRNRHDADQSRTARKVA